MNPYDDVYEQWKKEGDDVRKDVELKNPYDEVYQEAKNLINVRQNVSAVKASMTEAAKARRERELAERAKLPTDIVAEAPEIVSQSLKAQDINSNLLLFTPEEREFLSSLDRLPAIQDDLPQLNALSKVIQNPEWYETEEKLKRRGMAGNIARGIGARGMSLASDLLNFANNVANEGESYIQSLGVINPGLTFGMVEDFNATGRTPDFTIGDYGFELRRDIPASETEGIMRAADAIGSVDFGYIPRFTADRIKADVTAGNIAGFMTEQGLVSLPDMFAALLTMPAYVSARTNEIARARVQNDGGEGQPGIGDLSAAAPAAVASSLIERFAAQRLFNPVTKTVGGTIAAAVARGAGTEFVQDQIEYAGETIGTKKSFDVLESLERGAFGALAGSGVGGAVSSAQQAYSGIKKYNQSVRDKALLDAVNEIVAELKKGNASKDDIRGLVALAKKNGQVQDVFINAADLRDALDQAGLFPESIMEQMPEEVRQQYEQQLEIGGDVVIPLEYYASVLAETAAAEQIANMSRTVADGINVTEGQKWVDEQARPMVERLINFDPEQDRGPMDQVVQDLTGQMVAVGYDPNVAEAEAQRMSLMFGRIAAMAGMDAKALYDQVGLQIRREPTEAQRRRRATSQLDEMLDRLRAGDIPADRDIFGPSLLDFIREAGGIVDEGGELAAMDANVGTRVRRRDGQIQPTRNSPIARSLEEGARLPDDMAEAAWEAGYIPERDPNLLMSRISDELRGNPVFAMGSENAEMQNLVADLEQIDTELRRIGLDIGTMTNDEIIAELQRIAAEPAGEQLDQVGDQTQTESFRRWFGDSKVVDESGKPLVVYHGTKGDFESFRTGRAGGIYFTDDASWASAAAGGEAFSDDGGNVIPAFVSIENPAEIDYGGKWLSDAREIDSEVKKAIDDGHDGLIVRNIRDTNGEPHTQYVAFRPEQIKSAIGNRGTYDDSGNILNQDIDDYQGPPRSYEELIYDDVLERRRQEFAATGIQATEEQLRNIAAMAEPRMDEVTGAYAREARRVVLLEAMRAVRMGVPSVYISMDLANLGGLNQAGGTSGVDQFIFRPLVDIVRRELQGTGAQVSLIRQGGDEVSAVVIGADLATAQAAIEKARQAYQDEVVDTLLTAQDIPVAMLPNPKGGPEGTDLYNVAADVPATGDVDSYMGRVDDMVELEKKRRKGIIDEEAGPVGFRRADREEVAERKRELQAKIDAAAAGERRGRGAGGDVESRPDAPGSAGAGGASSLSETANRLLQPALAARAEREQLEQAGVLPEVEDERNLYVAHNLTAENLRHVAEIGGLAAPSLAVARIDKGDFDSFGEITLLARPSILESSKARTFDADVYTPRHPRAQYSLNRKKLDSFMDELRALPGDLRRPDESDLERGGNDMQYSDSVRLLFLTEKGIAPATKKQKAEPWLKKIAGLDLPVSKIYTDERVKKIVSDRLMKDINEVRKEDAALADEMMEETFTTDDDGNRVVEYGKWRRMVDQAVKFVESGGVDNFALQSDVSKKFRNEKLQAEFNEWSAKKFNSIVDGARLFKGFTPSGNRRYAPYTLENVVKEMTAKVQGGEGFNYGAGSVRSGFAKEMKTVAAVQRNRDRIVTDAEMKQIQLESGQRLQDAMEALRPFYKFDPDGWGYLNDASSAIGEGPKGWREAFELNEESRKIITDLTDYLKGLPTQYFESKLGRAVSLSEFEYAIVPKNTPADVLQILESAGIKVKSFDKKREGSKRKAIESTQNILFQESAPVDQTETPEFKRWFGDSKVVDESGKPLVVYHGTDSQRTVFDRSNLGRASGGGTGTDWGFFFAKDRDHAVYWAKNAGGGVVVEDVYLRIENPLIIYDSENDGGASLGAKIDDLMQDSDHDGVIIRGMRDDDSGYPRTAYIVLDSDQIKSATGNSGAFDPDSPNILEQQQNQSGARGSFFYDAMGKAVIQLGQASDLTTLPHESYHLFLDVMASLRDTSTELAGELDTVRKWLSGNVADLRRDAIAYAKKAKADQVVAQIEAMTDEQLKEFYAGRDLSLATLPAAGADRYLSVAGLEYFARAGEAYLLEGKAPSAETVGMFRRLKQWFLMVYRTAKDLKVNLSPEIVGLFNRMLATEEQITQAQELAGYGTSLADVDVIQWTDQERELIAKLTGQARDEAERQLMIEQLRDMKKQQQGWWAEEADKVRREVLDDLNRDPAYQARQMLTAGKRGDGSALPDGVEPIKLNKKALVDEFGEAYMKRLPSPRNADNRAPGYVYSAEGGVDPKIVARMYGFDSVREMVEALINSRPVKAYVDGLVNSEMRTRYPDINLSGEAAQIAREKVQNDKQAELMLAELKKLEQVQGKSVTPGQLYKEKARQIVAGLKIRHLSPATHRANAEKYQKIATREAVAGKLAEALEAKQKALIHHYVYREALRAEQEADRVYKLAKRLSGKSAQETIGKAGADYLERINEILDRYEFRRVSGRQLERRESMREWMKSKQEAGDYVDIPDEVLDRVQRVNYRDVTIDELSAVRDAVKNLEHVARFKSKLLADKKQRDLQEVVDAVVARLGQTQKKRKGKMFFQQKSWADKMLEVGQDYAAIALNMDSIISQLDGFEDIGPVYDALKRPIDEAARTRLPAMQQEYGDKLAEIYNRRFTRKEQRAMQDGYVELPGRGMISREEALSVALNTGNRYNREALTSGIASGGADQLTEADIKAVLDGLNKADWDFVQDVWDLLDYDLWPQVKEAQKRRTGVAPEKVEAEPVVTRFGVYRGGYYPVKFDTQLGWRVTAQEAEQMAQEVRMGQFAKASTKRGHTQARTNTAQQPLKLDLPVLHGHVNQVITDLALGDAINDVARVLAHKDFVSAMEASGNQWVLRALDLWLKDTAAQEVVASDIASRFSRRVRTGFTISRLAWNLGTILLQPTGLAQSVPDVGYKHLRQAMATVIRSDWTGDNNIVAQVRARSKFMATRGASFNKDIQVTMNAMKGSVWIESLLERTPWIKNIADGAGPQKASEMIKNSQMGGIVAIQAVVDTIVWLGAYEKGKTQFGNDADALQYADNMVARTQASGLFSDRTAFERGTLGTNTRQSEFVRMWTVLGSYMFAKANIAYQQTKNTNMRDPAQVLRWMHDMSMLYIFEAIFIGILRNTLPGEDDEDETLAGFIAKEAASNLIGGMPLMRELGSTLNGFQGGGALGGFWDTVGKAGVQLSQGEVDAALLKSLNNVGGIIFRYPSGQMNRTAEALWRDMNGEDVKAMDYLIWRQD